LVEFIDDCLDNVVKIDDVTDLEGHDEFHDFRKTLRSLDYLADVQPNAGLEQSIFKDGFDPAKMLEDIDDVYMLFGDLNSDIVSYLHDVEDGKKSKDKLKEEKEKLNEDWKDIKNDLEKDDFKSVLKDFQDELIKFD